MTKKQAITIWNMWAIHDKTRPLLSFIALHPTTITEDESYENVGGEVVQALQCNKAVMFMREMIGALEREE